MEPVSAFTRLRVSFMKERKRERERSEIDRMNVTGIVTPQCIKMTFYHSVVIDKAGRFVLGIVLYLQYL